MKTVESIIQYCLEEFKTKHNCHCVILYGSLARGDSRPESDFDLVGFSKQATIKTRDARVYEGRYLDLFIFPPLEYSKPNSNHLYIRGGKVLYDELGKGREFLNALEDIYRLGPVRIPEDEKQAKRIWAQKMISRAKVDDLEGRFRLSMLKVALLEDYFLFRDKWYLGSKESFSWLKKNDPQVFAKFERIFQPNASLEDLEELVPLVVK